MISKNVLEHELAKYNLKINNPKLKETLKIIAMESCNRLKKNIKQNLSKSY